MLNAPPPQNKARVEIVPLVAVETDSRFVRLDLGSPILGQRALPGQFFEVSCHGELPPPTPTPQPTGHAAGQTELGVPRNHGACLPAPLLNRPFSIHRWIDGGFSILFEVVGPGTRRLAAYQSGDRVLVIGPLGRGMREIPPGVTRLVLVAGGMGIAALTAFAQLAQRQRVPSWLYYGVNTATDLVFRHGPDSGRSLLLDEFDALGCRWSLASMGDRSFFPGTVVDLLESDWTRAHEPFGGMRSAECRVPSADPQSAIRNPQSAIRNGVLVIGCGPWAMLRALAAWSAAKNFRCHVVMEEMMGCGFGVCRSCVVPGFEITPETKTVKRNLAVCRDGPMIPAECIDWEKDWS